MRILAPVGSIVASTMLAVPAHALADWESLLPDQAFSTQHHSLFNRKPPAGRKPPPHPTDSIRRPRLELPRHPMPQTPHIPTPAEQKEHERAQLHNQEEESTTRARLAALVATKSQTIPRIIVVAARVKGFGSRFQAGFDDPERTLQAETSISPKIETYIQDWLNTPQDKRIYMTGARPDESVVRSVRKGFESDGYTVFFYQDCSRKGGHLCSEEAVGAFFATSGQVVSVNSPEARKSQYTNLEIGIIDSHVQDRSILVLSAEPLHKSMKIASQGGAVAEASDIAMREIVFEDDGLGWPTYASIAGAISLLAGGALYMRNKIAGAAGSDASDA